MKELHENIIGHIVRYLDGDILPEETMELVEWVNSDPESKKIFIEYKEVYYVSQTLSPSIENTEQTWKNFEKKIFGMPKNIQNE